MHNQIQPSTVRSFKQSTASQINGCNESQSSNEASYPQNTKMDQDGSGSRPFYTILIHPCVSWVDLAVVDGTLNVTTAYVSAEDRSQTNRKNRSA